jgi:hypothetical protein
MGFFYFSFGVLSLWDDIVPGSATVIPVWSGANSRFAALRELAGKGLICFIVCAAKRWSRRENRRNSGLGGNNREFYPTPPQGAQHLSGGGAGHPAIGIAHLAVDEIVFDAA